MLIFTEKKVGEGHYQAAKAIENVIRSHFHDQMEIKMFSGLNCIHPYIENLAVSVYFLLIRYSPKLWKWIYTKNKKSTIIQRHFFAFRLKKWIEQEQPDYVVCTHASCVPALNELKKKGKYDFKLYVVCTDFGFHPYFIQPEIDLYFVAHQKIKARLVREYAIQPHHVYDYGIPLRPEFESSRLTGGKNVVLMKDRNKFHVLILGGATGYGPIEKILQLFHPFFLLHPLQISVVTGKNQKLYTRLKRFNYQHVRVYGYVENMKYLLSQADLVITKPGGLTVTEAMACGTPLLAINPIPGHEEANFKFLEEQELALTVRDYKEIPLIINSMYHYTGDWERWKEKVREHYKENSALQIIQTIFGSSPSMQENT